MNSKILCFVNECEEELKDLFNKINENALYNQNKILNAFKKENVALRHFNGTSGYGYDDIGRDTLCKLYADIFRTESALVSPLIVSGTHAITLGLFGLLRPGDTMISVTGKPYDTLEEVICGHNNGSLKDFDVEYGEIPLIYKKGIHDFDYEAIENILTKKFVKLIFIGRSRGYDWRNAISLKQIEDVVKFIKKISPDTIVMADNCYGEFVEKYEPTNFGVDIMAGSLNKNPGGGIVACGGYLVGKSSLIDLAAARFTSPSIGNEVGSYAYGYTQMYQGLFMAPHVVAGAVKGNLLFGKVFEKLGYDTLPKFNSDGDFDLIRSIKLNEESKLIKFCEIVQENSPVDGNVKPEPWDMPGYEDKIIMAAGTFVQGASIELSADAPIKQPYIIHLQGALTYEHAKLVLLKIIEGMNLMKLS